MTPETERPASKAGLGPSPADSVPNLTRRLESRIRDSPELLPELFLRLTPLPHRYRIQISVQDASGPRKG